MLDTIKEFVFDLFQNRKTALAMFAVISFNVFVAKELFDAKIQNTNAFAEMKVDAGKENQALQGKIQALERRLESSDRKIISATTDDIESLDSRLRLIERKDRKMNRQPSLNNATESLRKVRDLLSERDRPTSSRAPANGK